MTTYVKHDMANAVHIVRDAWPNGTFHTQCGKWYIASMSKTVDLHGEREEDMVCAECRRLAAAQVRKKVYSQPTLRRGLSEAKRAKLRKDWQAHQERQRLAAWNKAAQETAQ